MTQEALKLALEALQADELDMVDDGSGSMVFRKEQAITAIKEALEQTQEPVAYIHRNEYNEYRLEPHDDFDIKSIPFNVDVPLFKAPQRTWVGLTAEQMLECNMDGDFMVDRETAKLNVQTKLKELNT